MKVLVTGATGYIGEAVARHLVTREHDVLGLTRDTSSARARRLSTLGVTCVAGDVGVPASYRQHLREVDVLVHTVTDKARPFAADADLSAELEELRDSTAAPPPHLIYTTGCSTYGAHDHDILTENTSTDPANERAALEKLLSSTDLPHTIVRPAFVFGGDGRSSLLGRWLDEARHGGTTFYGRRSKIWSWVHLDDLASGFAAITEHTAELDREVFLFADDSPVAALSTLAACQKRFAPSQPVPFAPIEEEDPLYRIFDRDEIINSDKARRLLNWTPTGPTTSEFIANAT